VSAGTTPRAIRIPDALWAAALALAQEQDTTVSEVVRERLQEWVDNPASLHG
jgi:hypothetical protein